MRRHCRDLKVEMIERRNPTMAVKDLFPRISGRAPVARSSSVNPLLAVHNESLFADIAEPQVMPTRKPGAGRAATGYAPSYAQMQAAASHYRRAISACLTARGYTLG
jgi:hypothetical protein